LASVATIADVARRAGVSIATVSRVLSPGRDRHPVRQATAERVRAAARELNFLPSPLARGLAARRSGLIGLIVPDLTDPHYPQIASGVEEAARQAELAVLISNTLGDPRRLSDYVRLLRARRVEAILLSGGTSLQPAELAAFDQAEMPVVLIGRPPAEVRLPSVSIDNVQAARAATRHLVELGRRRILHLSGPTSQTTMADRLAGYLAGLPGGAPPDVIETNGTPEDGYAKLAEQLRRRDAALQPDAIFASADRLAIAALAAAIDQRRRVPDDVAIVGFDDLPLAAHLRPSLTSVAQPAQQLGEAAIEVALRLIAGELVEPKVLPARLVPRASSQPAP
jgi:LacI family transcriptional regulator